MLIHTLKPLRTAIIGLGLLAGMSSAQAGLTISFEEDSANGHLNIIFGGSEIAAFNISNLIPITQYGFGSSNGALAAFVVSGNEETPGYMSAANSNWATSDRFPFDGGLGDLVSSSGSGGIYYMYGETSTNLYLFSVSEALEGGVLTWNAVMTYEGSLEDLGLADGQLGSFTFTNGTETFVINWGATVVPEPSTYALMLGLGVAGVALLRRRASRR